jgi:hypothetical protein
LLALGELELMSGPASQAAPHAALARARWLFRQEASSAAVLRALRESLREWGGACEAWQAAVSRELLDDPYLTRAPVSARLRRRVAKSACEWAEEHGGAVHERLLEVVLDSLNLDPAAGQGPTFMSFGFALADAPLLSVRVQFNPMRNVGLMAWQAGMILADLAAARPEEFRGKDVLELGAGVGLTGIALAKLCAPRSVTLTDFGSDVLENLAFNVAHNSAACAVQSLDWLDASAAPSAADLILVADCVYAPDLLGPLVRVLDEALGRRPGACALIVSTERNRDTFALFLAALERHGIWYREETQALPCTELGHVRELFFYGETSATLDRTMDRANVRFFRATRGSPPDACAGAGAGTGASAAAAGWRPAAVPRLGACTCCSPHELQAAFEGRFMAHNLPCLVGVSTELERCRREWLTDPMPQGTGLGISVDKLRARFGGIEVPVTGASCVECGACQRGPPLAAAESPQSAPTAIEDFLRCWQQHGTRGAGYLKDWHCALAFGQAYTTPRFFADDWLNKHALAKAGPEDFRFLYLGGAGTYTGLHHDVYLSFSWSANVTGTKLWLLFPPDRDQLERGDLEGGSYGRADLRLEIDPLLGWFAARRRRNQNQCRLLLEHQAEDERRGPFLLPRGQSQVCVGEADCGDAALGTIIEHALRGAPAWLSRNPMALVQEAGQALFVPSGWLHVVVNLEDCLSVNHNWLNRHNVRYCSRFIVNDLRSTASAIDDCSHDAAFRDICANVLKLNSGITPLEWRALLQAKLRTIKDSTDASEQSDAPDVPTATELDHQAALAALAELDEAELALFGFSSEQRP